MDGATIVASIGVAVIGMLVTLSIAGKVAKEAAVEGAKEAARYAEEATRKAGDYAREAAIEGAERASEIHECGRYLQALSMIKSSLSLNVGFLRAILNHVKESPDEMIGTPPLRGGIRKELYSITFSSLTDNERIFLSDVDYLIDFVLKNPSVLIKDIFYLIEKISLQRTEYQFIKEIEKSDEIIDPEAGGMVKDIVTKIVLGENKMRERIGLKIEI